MRCNLINIFAITCFMVLRLHAAEIEISQTNESGVYKVNEKITWTISAKGFSKEQTQIARYKLLRGGKDVVAEGSADLAQQPITVSGSLDKAGSFILHVSIPQEGSKPIKKDAGALVDPNNIKPSMPVPDDFDAFWEKQIARQNAVPMNPQLRDEKQLDPSVQSWLIDMDTIDGQKIRGRLVKPKAKGKYPALLIVQWAGVYGLSPYWSLGQAKRGFITLNILAHDIPVDKDKAYYAEQNKGPLKGYTRIGNDNRETSYFLRMFLSCDRGVEYLAQHPEWNGEVLMVTGNSQGGFQAFVAAGLNDKVTGVVAGVPAGCDHTAPLAGRAIGWPYWLSRDEDNQDKITASRYYDGVNFASKITCPVLVGFGLGDPTSRSEGIMAAINQMQGPVETVIMPSANHRGPHNAHHKRAEAWFNAAVKGEPLPVNK